MEVPGRGRGHTRTLTGDCKGVDAFFGFGNSRAHSLLLTILLLLAPILFGAVAYSYAKYGLRELADAGLVPWVVGTNRTREPARRITRWPAPNIVLLTH